MLFAIVIYGCFLGWFRFFRVSNLYLALNSFFAQSRYPAFAGVLYIVLYIICLAMFFDFDGLQSLLQGSKDTEPDTLVFSITQFTYFAVAVIFAEICAAINNIEDDSNVLKRETEGFMDLLQSLSPEYHMEGAIARLIGEETCAAIEVLSWLYGTRSDVKRSLIIAVSKEYNVSRFYRSEILDYFNMQTGSRHAAKKAIKKLVKKHGKGSDLTVSFLEKIAKIGKRSGMSISGATKDLSFVGALLGISDGVVHSTLNRASKASTDTDWRDFSDSAFWERRAQNRTRQSQKTYSRREYTQSNSSRHYQKNAQPLSERQKFLRVLGLAEGATEKDIRSAYRKLAMKYHPDRVQADGGSEEDVEKATEKMSDVNMAYDWLCDSPS